MRASHLEFSWIVFRAHGRIWGAQHLGMPFGATSSVYAWHRVGNLLAWLILTQARSPVGRYVDDFFGAARTDIRWTGGYLLDILSSCLGFLTDPSKANDFRWVMDVLGVEALGLG